MGDFSALKLIIFCFLAIDRMKEKKSKFVGMALPCITQYIRGIQLTDEKADQKQSGSKLPVAQCVMKHVLDFLRPFVQEVSMKSSSSEIVRSR